MPRQKKRTPKQGVDMSAHFSIPALLKYTAPSVGMMVFVSIYEVVDGFFVSNYVNSTALAAVNIAYPVFLILGTIGYMMGTGGSAIVARTYGEGDPKRANELFSLFVYASIAGAVAFTVAGIPLLPLLFALMGAQGELLEMSVSYGTILMFGLVLDVLQYIFQNLTMTAGKPKVGFWATVAAGVTNIALDALFVGFLGWGIEGAAIATVVGLAFGGLIPLVYFLLPNSSMLRLGRCSLDWRALGAAAANGSSEMVSNIAMSLVAIVYNTQLLKFIGEPGVAAYSVIGYVALFFAGVFMGYSVGAAPLMSFQHGNGNKAEMRSLFKKGTSIMAVCGVVMFLLTRVAAVPLSMLFVGYDEGLMELTVHAFSIYSTAFLLMGLNMFASSLFTSLSNGKVSAALSFMRTLVFEIGCAFLLPLVLGPDGIWYSVIVAEVLALAMSAACVLWLGPVYGIVERRPGSRGPVEP
ncbi:MAG: MATE family efflux transporter [Coriobacteriales bacterium]